MIMSDNNKPQMYVFYLCMEPGMTWHYGQHNLYIPLLKQTDVVSIAALLYCIYIYIDTALNICHTYSEYY